MAALFTSQVFHYTRIVKKIVLTKKITENRMAENELAKLKIIRNTTGRFRESKKSTWLGSMPNVLSCFSLLPFIMLMFNFAETHQRQPPYHFVFKMDWAASIGAIDRRWPWTVSVILNHIIYCLLHYIVTNIVYYVFNITRLRLF